MWTQWSFYCDNLYPVILKSHKVQQNCIQDKKFVCKRKGNNSVNNNDRVTVHERAWTRTYYVILTFQLTISPALGPDPESTGIFSQSSLRAIISQYNHRNTPRCLRVEKKDLIWYYVFSTNK